VYACSLPFETPPTHNKQQRTATQRRRTECRLGLYKILPSPILLWCMASEGRVDGGRILRNGRAIRLQYCWQCGWGVGNKEELIRAQNLWSERISCIGRVPGQAIPAKNAPLQKTRCSLYIYVCVCVCKVLYRYANI